MGICLSSCYLYIISYFLYLVNSKYQVNLHTTVDDIQQEYQNIYTLVKKKYIY